MKKVKFTSSQVKLFDKTLPSNQLLGSIFLEPLHSPPIPVKTKKSPTKIKKSPPNSLKKGSRKSPPTVKKSPPASIKKIIKKSPEKVKLKI